MNQMIKSRKPFLSKLHLQSHMRHQRSFLQEFFATNCASVWYTSMYPAMIDQLKFARERCATVTAHERIDRAVESRVHYQVILLGEALAALFTNVRTFTCMELAVRDQMSLQWKSSAAFLANEWTFTTVYSRMGQQVMLQCEALLAFTALIWTIRRVKQQVGI